MLVHSPVGGIILLTLGKTLPILLWLAIYEDLIMYILMVEEQKSTEQKEREAHLLKELIELIDERDKLERRKMINMRK